MPISRILLISILLIPFQLSAQLSKTEKKLISYIEEHNQEATDFLIEVVNINSGSMNFEGVKEVGDRFGEKFREIGMEVEWIDGTPFNRAGHLVARSKGKGKKLLLIGHLDTVFELESPFQKAEFLNDSTVRGPGICDMKGGDVIILQAMRALYDIGKLDDLNIVVVITGDEELSGKPLDLARKILKDEASDSDYVLGFENGDGDPTTALISRRGSSSWELEVTGNPSHSSQIFSESIGAGAIYEISRILSGFYEELAGEQYLTFNPGLVLGGTLLEHNKDLKSGNASGKNNVVSQKAIASGDIRTISPEQYERTKETMQSIVAKHYPQTGATLTFNEGYPPLPPSEGNKQLLSYLNQVSLDLGMGEVVAVDPMKAGAADVSFTSGLAPMIIDGLGLGGVNDHTVNETADLETLLQQSKKATVLIWRLANMK